MAYTQGTPARYRGSLADYKAVNFVLPTSSPSGLGRLGDTTAISSKTLLIGAVAAAAIWWFGFRKK